MCLVYSCVVPRRQDPRTRVRLPTKNSTQMRTNEFVLHEFVFKMSLHFTAKLAICVLMDLYLWRWGALILICDYFVGVQRLLLKLSSSSDLRLDEGWTEQLWLLTGCLLHGLSGAFWFSRDASMSHPSADAGVFNGAALPGGETVENDRSADFNKGMLLIPSHSVSPSLNQKCTSHITRAC